MAAAHLAPLGQAHAMAARGIAVAGLRARASVNERAPQVVAEPTLSAVAQTLTASGVAVASSLTVSDGGDGMISAYASGPGATPSYTNLAAAIQANPQILNDPSVSSALANALGYTASAATSTAKHRNKGAASKTTSIAPLDADSTTSAPKVSSGSSDTMTDTDSDASTTTGLSGSVSGTDTDSDSDSDMATSTSSSPSGNGGFRMTPKFGWLSAALLAAGYFASL